MLEMKAIRDELSKKDTASQSDELFPIFFKDGRVSALHLPKLRGVKLDKGTDS